METNEIVRGLLGYCKYEVTGHGERWTRVDISDLQQAADLIESQAAEMAKLLERIAELEGQLAEETSRRYQAECNYDHWKADCEQLRAQLAASQQRERALLDDIAQDMACGICVHGRVDIYNEPCSSCRGNSSKFEWRGPQEAGEGERDG